MERRKRKKAGVRGDKTRQTKEARGVWILNTLQRRAIKRKVTQRDKACQLDTEPHLSKVNK